MTDELYERTPSLAEVMERAARSVVGKVHTALPAVVQSYDGALQRAVVVPAIKGRLNTGERFAYPPLLDVPVQYPQAAEWAMHYPLAEGSAGLLLCCERSIEEWLAAGGVDSEPSDPRRFDLQDAIFLPGISATPAPIPAAMIKADALTLGTRDGQVRVEVRQGGIITLFGQEVRLGNDTATALAIAALVDARISAIVAAFNAHTHTSAASGSPTSSPLLPLSPQASTAAQRAKGV